MLVANSFDLWQKDAFFAAAEEVQQSADIMESAYRTWLSARRDGLLPLYLDELGRQLQMSLGTAKWQLDEFEKAVRMSYRGHGDDSTVNRHGQFVSAIEEQISTVEAALKQAFEMDGNKPFRWVHLDEQECDDLAHFLSGTSVESKKGRDEGMDCGTSFKQNKSLEQDDNLYSEVSSKIQSIDQGKCLEEVVARNDNTECFPEQEESRFLDMGAGVSYEADEYGSNQRTWNTPDMLLEIVIDKDDGLKNALIEVTPKEKGTKPGFWNLRGEDLPRAKGMLYHTQMKVLTWINQCLRGQRNQRQHYSSVLPVKSIRYILALMLTVFFVVPFLVYSN